MLGFSTQDTEEESGSGKPTEAELVNLDFLGDLDVPVSTFISLVQFLWSKGMRC